MYPNNIQMEYIQLITSMAYQDNQIHILIKVLIMYMYSAMIFSSN